MLVVLAIIAAIFVFLVLGPWVALGVITLPILGPVGPVIVFFLWVLSGRRRR